jgi:acyl-CoA thioesterase-2
MTEHAESETVPLTVDYLLELLDIEELDRDLFRAQNPQPPDRGVLYGGQVAAQALIAASRTVPDGRRPHSLHGYFLRPGQVDRPTILRVDRDRDGRSFSARHVVAVQDGEVIFSMVASFHLDEQGVDFEPPPPVIKPPEELYVPDVGGAFHSWSSVFEFRLGRPDRPFPGFDFQPGPATLWVRTRKPVGDDPLIHTAILAYVSDLGSGFVDLGLPIYPPGGGPSLDHAVWFHRPLAVDEWFLLHQEPLIATGGRGLYHGAIYDHQWKKCASIAQELLARPDRRPTDTRESR